MSYSVGDLVRLTAEITKADDGALLDPSAITLKVMKPDRTVATFTTPTIVRDSLGVFHFDQSADQPGVWRYRYQTTGAGQAAHEAVFEVQESKFP